MAALPHIRETFRFPIYFMPDVFTRVLPIHMAKGMAAMRAKVNRCDVVIEVRDARVPLASCNPQFEYLYAQRPRIILMNKIDLADKGATKELVNKHLTNNLTRVVYTNCKGNKDSGIKVIMKHIKSFIKHNEIHNQDEELTAPTTKALVCGIPNVGKSSFINAARHRYTQRKGKATAVGKKPGITKSVLSNIVISESPRITILDTPGIIPPQINDPIIGVRLACIGTFPDHIIGEEVIADYILYSMNQQKNAQYLDFCGLQNPTDDFDEVITSISNKYGLYRNRKPCYRNCSLKFVSQYRQGQFGRITLDF